MAAIVRGTGDVQLHRLAAIATEMGATGLSTDAITLAERVAEGRFYVACIGQFKRGKSTLLNALVGRAVLPASIVPVTAVPTVLRYGAGVGVRVVFANGSSTIIDTGDLESYVSEEHNPGNVKGVDIVEVFVPSPLLAVGMCLVDTPGIGSVFASNTATTHAFIPHVDAALVVVGADPPISGDELALMEHVGRSVQHLIVVLNKADRFTDAERNQAVAFTANTVRQRLHRTIERVYAVSATEQLAHTGPPRDWADLVTALEKLADADGDTIIDRSETRGVSRIAAGCREEIGTALRALREPIAESNRRLASLQAYIAAVEFQLPRLGSLVAIEQQQTTHTLAIRRDAFLAAAIPEATAELWASTPGLYSSSRGPSALRDDAFNMARQVAHEYLDPWFAVEKKFAAQLYSETASRFVDLANTFLGDVAGEVERSGRESTMSHPAARALDPARQLTATSRFYFHDVESLVRSASPWSPVLDFLRPRAAVRRGIAQRAAWYLEQLLQINSTRVRNDIDDRIVESGRQLESDVRALLRNVAAGAERAIQRARVAQAEGAERVIIEIARLEELRKQVDEIQLAIRPSAHEAVSATRSTPS